MRPCQLACDGQSGRKLLPHRSLIDSATAGWVTGKEIIRFSALSIVGCVFLIAAAFAQSIDPSNTFSDLSTEYDGGVANPADGSTGDALQQTLLAAYFWGIAHGGARATVVVSSDYPIHGSRILVPGNVDLVCSSYTSRTYTGGCAMFETDPGNDMVTGGSPLLMVDVAQGFLSDRKTRCSIADTPQKPDCTIINGSGATIRGFSLYGSGSAAGGADVGIRVAANHVHIQDTAIAGSFGGPGIQNVSGHVNSFDWNYGTNVNTWWCANPSQLTSENLKASLQKSDGSLGAIDLIMTDGEASHNRYSTGCAFSKGFTVSLDYPHFAAMNVGGAGNIVESNLLHDDAIGLIVGGQEQHINKNHVEYHAREGIRSIGVGNIFSNNRIISACLDPNLANLRPGSLDRGTPRYPSTPQFLYNGYIIKDPNGNIEQVVHGRPGGHGGTSDESSPDWPLVTGGRIESSELIWENIGSWKNGLRFNSFPAGGPIPALVNGICYAVTDLGQSNIWRGTRISEKDGVNGPSYLRGDYFIVYPGVIRNNSCDRDWPDAYGNGQCWWGFDLYANGGPSALAPNGQRIMSSGGGTAWIGDYSVLELTDLTLRHYNNFQGMADGQSFMLTSTNSADVIDPRSESRHGRPAVQTCTGGPTVISPGQYHEFHYDAANGNTVTQVDCSDSGTGTSSSLIKGPDNSFAKNLSGASTEASSGRISVVPGSLAFASQMEGTTGASQTVTVTNPSNHLVNLLIALSGDSDYVPYDTCIGSVAPGTNCTISVRFRPTNSGSSTGTLTITDLNGGYSRIVVLTGSGAQQNSPLPTIALSSSVTCLQVTAVGHAATSDVYITPENGFRGQVNLQCTVVAENQIASAALPACSLSRSQLMISDERGSSSKLSVSIQADDALAESRFRNLRRGSLAGLAVLGLLPLGWRQKRISACLFLPLVMSMIGCGYVPNTRTAINATSSNSYKVTLTATSGAQRASVSIPLEVK
jgi:hypothetical protein